MTISQIHSRRPDLLHWLTLCLLLAVFAVPMASGQEPQQTQIADVKLGFAGDYKAGCWTQLEVTIAGAEKATALLTVTMPDSDGVPVSYVSPPERLISVSPGGVSNARLMVRPGQTGAGLKLDLVSTEGKLLAGRKYVSGYEAGPGIVRTGHASTNRLIVGIGNQSGLAELVRSQNNDIEDYATRLASVEDPASLPLDWQGYEGVEAVILTTSDPQFYRSLSANSTRLDALHRWIELGGRLVVFCGAEAEELLGDEGPLMRFAPGKFAGMAPLRDSSKIERFASVNESINRGRIDLRIPRFENIEGKVLASAGNEPGELPLAVRRWVGLGEVTFVGLDPDAAPLSRWEGRTELLRAALGWPILDPDDQQQVNDYAYASMPDFINQLRSALDNKFEGVTPVPFGLVALLVLLYIALIGPGDYFFVKRVLKRMELTWVTFPLTVALVSAGAYWLAYYLKGDQLRVNQVEIVDVDVRSGDIRGTVWTNFFSPRAKKYQLTLKPHFANQHISNGKPPLTAWLGMPGVGLGGMQAGGMQTTMFDRGYHISPTLDAIRGLPVQEWSTKTITARWTGEVDDANAPINARLQIDEDGMLTGRLENTSGVNWQECLLLHNTWAYRLKSIAAGETTKLNASTEPKSVKTVLTGNSTGSTNNGPNYAAHSGDIPGILRTMMFYEAAGGTSFASTVSRYQHFVDLSHLLDGDQAILLARVKVDKPSQWFDEESPLRSDKDLNWTYYRFVIPLKKLEVLGP